MPGNILFLSLHDFQRTSALNSSGSRGLFGVCPCRVESQGKPVAFFWQSNELLICCSSVCVSQRSCVGQTVNPKNKRKIEVSWWKMGGTLQCEINKMLQFLSVGLEMCAQQKRDFWPGTLHFLPPQFYLPARPRAGAPMHVVCSLGCCDSPGPLCRVPNGVLWKRCDDAVFALDFFFFPVFRGGGFVSEYSSNVPS